MLSGYREIIQIDKKVAYNYITPKTSYCNKLFDVYRDEHFSRAYHDDVMTQFLDNHFSRYVSIIEKKVSRGVSENVLTGRQIIFKEIAETIQTVLDLKTMPTGGLGTDQMKRKVASYFLMSEILSEFYKIPNTRQDKSIPWRDTRYFRVVRNNILSGTSGDIVFGYKNHLSPLFNIDQTNAATGFHIPIDPSKLTDYEFQQVLWTLEYHETYRNILPEFFDNHLAIDNIWNEIKDPIKEKYDRLYDILWNSPNNEFVFRFYQTHSTGVDQNKVLKNTIPAQIQKDNDLGINDGTAIRITLDRNNPQSRAEFNEKVLSAVHYLAKYPYSFTVVKTGNDQNLLYASLTEILDEGFVRTSFSNAPKIIGGALSSYAISNYEKWKNGHIDEQSVHHFGWNQDPEHSGKQLFTIMNIYPIYLFADGNSDQFGRNDFAGRIINFFMYLSGEKYEGINKIHRLQ
jgi:hypothetical protein